MSVITFREITLLEAERQLAGRCLTNERLLRICLEDLPLNAWRSEQGEDLSRIFYALAGRLGRGAFDPETNEDDLAAGFGAMEPDRAWTDALDALWSPWMAVEQYADGVLDALVTAYRQTDAVVQAMRERLDNTPLQIDTGFEDDLWWRLREAIARRRTERYRKQWNEQQSAPPPPPAAYEPVRGGPIEIIEG